VIADPTLPSRDLPLTGWGDPARRTGLPPRAIAWLTRRLALGSTAAGGPSDGTAAAGPSGGTAAAGPSASTGTAPPTTAAATGLSETARAALIAAVGEAYVHDDDDSRLRHGGGKSYLDLLRRRLGDRTAPDAVVVPGDHEEVLAVLTACSRHRIAVVPFGGGTSVVGGLDPVAGVHRAVVSLDLRRLDAITEVDPESLTAWVGAGTRGPELERALGRFGLTLGHHPQSYEHATIGGYAATRSAGQASNGYGRFDEMVETLRVATPAGELEVGRAPASAAGPDLRAVLLGSEGVLGVVTAVKLRLHRAPATVHDEAWSFRRFDDGVTALRRLAQAGLSPDVTRLSDEEETAATLRLTGGAATRLLRGALTVRGHRHGCLLITGWEGSAATIADRRRAASSVLRASGAVRAGTGVSAAWRKGRYAGPYLRDDLMDAGILVETLETATSWTDLVGLLERLRTALREALEIDGVEPLVLAHVSHVYPTGASLYLTVLARRDDDAGAEQWLRAKRAASDVLVASGATITHHHGVGADHRRWYAEEVGPLGVAVLRAVKAVLDPAGVLNPGKLLPD